MISAIRIPTSVAQAANSERLRYHGVGGCSDPEGSPDSSGADSCSATER